MAPRSRTECVCDDYRLNQLKAIHNPINKLVSMLRRDRWCSGDSHQLALGRRVSGSIPAAVRSAEGISHKGNGWNGFLNRFSLGVNLWNIRWSCVLIINIKGSDLPEVFLSTALAYVSLVKVTDAKIRRCLNQLSSFNLKDCFPLHDEWALRVKVYKGRP